MIPKIHPGILDSIIVEMDGPQKDPDWPANMFTKLQIDNPILAKYLSKVQRDVGEHAALVGLVVCKMIESQMEANQLNELFLREESDEI